MGIGKIKGKELTIKRIEISWIISVLKRDWKIRERTKSYEFFLQNFRKNFLLFYSPQLTYLYFNPPPG